MTETLASQLSDHLQHDHPVEPIGLRPGATVRYRSLAGGEYDATLVGIRPDGSLDLEVLCPNTIADGLLLTRIKVGEALGECQL